MPRARQFLDEMSRLSITAIGLKGLSTGIDDEDVPETARKEIDDGARQGARSRSTSSSRSTAKGELEQMPGRSVEETLEVDGPARARQGARHRGRHRGPLPRSREPRRHSRQVRRARLDAQPDADGRRRSASSRCGASGCSAATSAAPSPTSSGATSAPTPAASSRLLQARDSPRRSTSSTRWAGARVSSIRRSGRAGPATCSGGSINALEDLNVAEDGTVRNTAGTVIEYQVRRGRDRPVPVVRRPGGPARRDPGERPRPPREAERRLARRARLRRAHRSPKRRWTSSPRRSSRKRARRKRARSSARPKRARTSEANDDDGGEEDPRARAVPAQGPRDRPQGGRRPPADARRGARRTASRRSR